MWLYERELDISSAREHRGLLAHFGQVVEQQLGPGERPVRFVVSATDAERYHCEVGILAAEAGAVVEVPSIFEFRKRALENTEKFNVVLLVPTGINATIGGHAGDAGPVARLVASVADTLITHPNVVNGSDINEMAENTLYVEGSVICRLLMGTAGLQRVRSNRLLLVIDKHEEVAYSNAAINALNAARACYGLDCPRVLMLDPPVKLVSEYTSTGRAAGRVDNLGDFLAAIAPYRAEYDALAVSSVIDVPPEFHQDYFDSAGDMVNPWGGVEAIFTHALSLLSGIPSAHSPMIESEEVEEIDPGIVDPRMAAEAVSLTYLQSILKGLQRSPRIVTDPAVLPQPSILTARDVACIVIPDGCLGLPTLAALEQGIPVIAVRDNSNLMHNDITALPWAPGQLCVVDSYLEAVGALCARRAGLALGSLRRPILPAPVTEVLRPTGKRNAKNGKNGPSRRDLPTTGEPPLAVSR
ncbi:MAG TPA: DUF3326 domain-containing protein [Isosphaeraceae bacterium]|nr:DUF3326 domain-containing protein [Isosphaeraceae bacterium]